MDINKTIAKEMNIEQWQVSNTRNLIKDGKSLPFIARYRKEVTGSLTETQLRKLFELSDYLEKLQERKEEILKSIEEQGKLTQDLKNKILQAEKLVQLEDLYLPFKKKKKTKADIAIENGLDKLAKFLKTSNAKDDNYIKSFVNDTYPDIQSVMQGAKDILSKEVSENIQVRSTLRDEITKTGYLISKKTKYEDENEVYKDYYDFKIKFSNLQSYQVLALKRGEKKKILRLSLEFENDQTFEILKTMNYQSNLAYFEDLAESVQTALKQSLIPSLFNEAFAIEVEKAQKRSAEIFAKNLRNLMLQKPLSKKRILAIDPGFRTGCKVVAIDEYGEVLKDDVIYPNPPVSDILQSEIKIKKLIQTYGLNYVVIGNKTASQETREFIVSMIKKYDLNIKYAMVSEDGASVYSASKTAVEEFPQYDVTTRGAISIGKRVQDPMAELVKIPPQSIGVGMYQHDLNSKIINMVLQQEVESIVNFVGVNLNTASKHLLKYISGLNSKTAANIVEYRKKNGPFKSRKELLKVPGIGPKAYEQAAGFCRIPNASNPLDNTIIHPEKYELANKVLNYFKTTVSNFENDVDENMIDYEKVSKNLNCSIIDLKDIVQGILTQGLDPREDMPQIKFSDKIIKIENLNVGDVVEGRVTNVVDFGAFVDIGIKTAGLVHKSNISQKYVQDPTEILKVGEIIKARIISIDTKRKRIGLSIKDL